MEIESYLKTQEINSAELKHILSKIDCLWATENISELLDFEKLIRAGKLCAAYPHLNTNLVNISLVLAGLISKGFVGADLNSILTALVNMDLEEKLRVLQVLVEAQTDYASGEAKIVQYFYH